MSESESESESGLVNQPNSLTPESTMPSYQSIDDQASLNDVGTEFDTEIGAAADLENVEGDKGAIKAEVASPSNMGFDDQLLSNNIVSEAGLDASLDAGLDSGLVKESDASLDAGLDANLVKESDASLDAGLATGLATDSDASLADPSLETNSPKQKSITIEITKEKLDELLTKISEETINYLSLLIKFMEKKSQFDSNNEKMNKTIQELTKIKDDIIKLLTENKITSNGFDPSSGAQKSQYAEMIMAALGIAAAVTGGKRTKSKKRGKKHKKTKNLENKHHNHKTKKHRRKKCKTKGQMIKIKNDPVNKENN